MSDSSKGSWSRNLAVFGALVGVVAGSISFESLVMAPRAFQVWGILGLGLSGMFIFGGWRLRWGLFPWARALGGVLLILTVVAWNYQKHPPSERVEMEPVAGPKTAISGSDFSISGVSPGITDKEVEARLGRPTHARSYVEEQFGMSVEYTRARYGPKVTILYLEGRVQWVAGDSLEVKRVNFFKAGDYHKRVAELWGNPSLNESKPGYDVYGGWLPAVGIRYEADKLTGFELGERVGAAQPIR